MDRREMERLCDRVVDGMDVPQDTGYRAMCQKLGQTMSEVLGASVEVRFFTGRGTPLTGATARRADGTYLVFCVKTRSWYHRLGILLHEFAHILLGHEPVDVGGEDTVRRLAPSLPRNMARVIARRTTHSVAEEAGAEELADLLIERLTERRTAHGPGLPGDSPHVLRAAEDLGLMERRRRAD
ncbi:hypothetical protein [Streptomyces sp. NPDC005017]|uniref:hypothetical protein n=1 Tax=Streptomyces sp. NPDC005017 TaxID=3364706 RepID=UPI0036B25011